MNKFITIFIVLIVIGNLTKKPCNPEDKSPEETIDSVSDRIPTYI